MLVNDKCPWYTHEENTGTLMYISATLWQTSSACAMVKAMLKGTSVFVEKQSYSRFLCLALSHNQVNLKHYKILCENWTP